MDVDELSNIVHHRSKRFLYVENKTCGHIAFCSARFHDSNMAHSTALFNHPECSKYLIITFIIVDIFLSVVITASNSLIILIIRRSKSLRNCQGVFKVNLAIFDLIMGLLVIPGCTYNKVRFFLVPLEESYIDALFRYDDEVINKIFGIALTTSLSGSLMSLFMLSLDRCLAVTSPFRYKEGKRMTMRRAYALVVVVWCVVGFLAVVPFADNGRFQYTVNYMTMAFSLEIRFNWKAGNIYHGLFFLFVVFIVPYISIVAITVITWIMVVRDNRRTNKVMIERRPDGFEQKTEKSNRDLLAVPGMIHRESLELKKDVTSNDLTVSATLDRDGRKKICTISKSMNSLTRTVKSKLTRNKHIDKAMLRLTSTITLIIAVFSVCVLPFIIVQADNLSGSTTEFTNIEKYGEGSTPTPHQCLPVLYITFLYMVFANSFCNFIVYNLRNVKFREEFLRFIKYRKNTSAHSLPEIPSGSSTASAYPTSTV